MTVINIFGQFWKFLRGIQIFICMLYNNIYKKINNSYFIKKKLTKQHNYNIEKTGMTFNQTRHKYSILLLIHAKVVWSKVMLVSIIHLVCAFYLKINVSCTKYSKLSMFTFLRYSKKNSRVSFFRGKVERKRIERKMKKGNVNFSFIALYFSA